MSPLTPPKGTVVITGLGHVCLAPGESCDPRSYLKVRKSLKFMGTQEALAVVAAGRALESAGLAGHALGGRTGLYFAVGYIPFEARELEALYEGSAADDGSFSMARFSTAGVGAVNPLLTFRCLPNMPAYHVSVNFELRGPYLVTYPGPGQLYLALEESRRALLAGEVDVALLGAVAYQRNLLVEHHFARLEPPVAAERLGDAAGCLVLETESHAARRGATRRGRLLSLEIGYRPHDPFAEALPAEERFEPAPDTTPAEGRDLGAASLPVFLSFCREKPARIRHRLKSRDGIVAESEWQMGPAPLPEVSGGPASPVHRYRVAVTGLGVVSPIGIDVAAFERSLFAGVSGAGPITLFDASALPTRIAAEVGSESRWLSFHDRKIGFALEAAHQALAEAAACGSGPGGAEGGADACLSLGIGLELFSLPDLFRLRRPGFRWPAALRDRLSFLQTPSDLCLHLISHRHALGQAPVAHISACAAGADAIGHAFRLVASGRRRWVLAGGTDSMINPLGVAGFCKIHATSTANEDPGRASRPFDRRRDGFVLGEGAGMLVLERLEDAVERGAAIRAEITGYGGSFDAHGISEPHPGGRGALEAMERALAEAGISPEAVDAVNAHGTSTPKNDPVETLAIQRLLGERAREVPVPAPKSMIGHLIAAAGAVEAIAAILGLVSGRVHPTVNLEEPDPACDLDYVREGARRHPQRYVLSNSFAFGGQNACLVLKRYDGS